MNRKQTRRMMFAKHRPGQAHLPKHIIVQAMTAPDMRLHGSESVDRLVESLTQK